MARRDRRIRGLQAARWADEAADRRLTDRQAAALLGAIHAWVAEHERRAKVIHAAYWAREAAIRSGRGASCDVCGERPAEGTTVAYGLETAACGPCRGRR